jgi:hypothetical protein
MLNYFTTLFMATNIAILGVVGYMLFWPAPLPIIYNEPFPLDKYEVERGGQISYLIHLNKRADYNAHLNRNIICDDGNLVTLAPQHSRISKGEHEVWVTVTVPEKTSLGTCHLEMNNSYEINPIRTEYMTLISQDFEVIK